MKKSSKIDATLLINSASVAKENGKSLSSVFRTFAKENSMAVGSVRNYYYKTVKSSVKNSTLSKKLEIPERLIPAFIKEFTLIEEKELLYFAIKKITLGSSVRAVVYELANQNDKLALRYQNKLRNLIKNRSPLILEATEKVKNELGFAVNIIKPIKNKTCEYKRLEIEINKMLDNILRSVSAETYKLKKRADKLQKENVLLKNVVKETMREKGFYKTDDVI